MAAGAAVRAWMLVLSLWGEPLPHHQPSPQKAPRPVPKSPPPAFQEPGYRFPVSLILPVLVLPAPISLPSIVVLSPRGSHRGQKHHSPDREATGAELQGSPQETTPAAGMETGKWGSCVSTSGYTSEIRVPSRPPPFFISPFPKGLHC